MGLQVASWQPNGRHLYVAQQTANGPRVLLFETNGLQHGGFDIGPSGVHHQAVAGMLFSYSAALFGNDDGCTGIYNVLWQVHCVLTHKYLLILH